MELLGGDKVALCWTLLKKKKNLWNYYPKSLFHFSFQQAMNKCSNCSTASQLLMLPVFTILAFLYSVYLYLILVLIYISLFENLSDINIACQLLYAYGLPDLSFSFSYCVFRFKVQTLWIAYNCVFIFYSVHLSVKTVTCSIITDKFYSTILLWV